MGRCTLAVGEQMQSDERCKLLAEMSNKASQHGYTSPQETLDATLLRLCLLRREGILDSQSVARVTSLNRDLCRMLGDEDRAFEWLQAHARYMMIFQEKGHSSYEKAKRLLTKKRKHIVLEQ